MPFHINYTGPAPISTYLLVEPTSEDVGAPTPSPKHSAKDDEFYRGHNVDEISGGAEVSCSATTMMKLDFSDGLVVPPAGDHTTSEPASGSHAAVQGTPHNQQKIHLLPENATASRPSFPRRVTDATTRFISSFRGRMIQGLKVELPPGYVGVVLKAEGKLGEKNKATGKTRDSTKGKPGKTKAKGRSTRNSARVIDVDAEEDNMDDAMNVDELSADVAAIRTLVPASQFSSFVLWHADNPVDERRDEYFRSLTEWTRLAHEVRM